MKKRNAFYQTSFDDSATEAAETPAPAPDDTIDSFRAEFDFLSNFFEQPVVVEGIAYPTAEHAFQAMKVREQNARYHIQQAPTPAAAKARGKKVSLREDWETARFAEMKKVLRLKFADPELRRRLIATGDRQLIEGNTWRDTTWGCVRDGAGGWKGRNELGKILMRLRDAFRAEDSTMTNEEAIPTATEATDPATAELVRVARAAREHAYAPYSGYKVGAAVRTADGRILFGCNVENASYGLTVCAERNAIFAAVAAGAREITAIAVVTENGGSPCGACRQVLAEFTPKNDDPLRIFLANTTGAVVQATNIAELLPLTFALRRAEGG